MLFSNSKFFQIFALTLTNFDKYLFFEGDHFLKQKQVLKIFVPKTKTNYLRNLSKTKAEILKDLMRCKQI